MEVEVNLLQPSPYQPRLIFDLETLKQEIKKDGLLCDLIVRPRGEFYELIDGERRYRAIKELGWKTVPVQVVDADDAKAMLSVFKMNKVRQNYTVEEEALFFKKLRDEDMTLQDISKQLNVDSRWVLAHLNIFKFPENIQKAVWTKQIRISHIMALKKVIERNIKEAVFTANEILKKKLTTSETRKIVEKREKKFKARVDEKRVEAAEKVLPVIAPKIPKLETPEEFEKAAEALKETAIKIRKGILEPKEINERAKRFEEETATREEIEKNPGKPSPRIIKSLRKKIEALEKTKASLLEKKSFLTKALSFNCPHCNNSCIIYREGDGYWVE